MVGIIDTPEKEHANFVDLVRRMRLAQKNFFREKNKRARLNFMYEAKDLERVVDGYVKDFVEKAAGTGTLL